MVLFLFLLNRNYLIDKKRIAFTILKAVCQNVFRNEANIIYKKKFPNFSLDTLTFQMKLRKCINASGIEKS